MVKCVSPTCCSTLSRYRSITGCRGLLLKLVERMDSRIRLRLFQICWLVCIVSAENMIQIAPRTPRSMNWTVRYIQVRYRELREGGVGAVVKHAAVVSPDEEQALWDSEVVGDHDPLALQRAVFFYVSKTFCLRGGQELRGLKPSQFICSSNPDCYTYVENGSKNKSGVNPKENNKVIPVYANSTARPRCLVYLLDKYFSKFSPKGKVWMCSSCAQFPRKSLMMNQMALNWKTWCSFSLCCLCGLFLCCHWWSWAV